MIDSTAHVHTPVASEPPPPPLSWRRAVISVGGLLIAVALVALQISPWIRWIAVPVLIAVPGEAAVRLIFGALQKDSVARTRPVTVDGATRAALAVLLGLLLLLPELLLLHSVGWRLTPMSMAVTAGAVGVVLVLAASLWVPAIRPTRDHPMRRRTRRRRVISVVIAMLVLGGSTAAALAMQVTPKERYATLQLLDAEAFSGRELQARPFAPIRVNWMLRTFGFRVDPNLATLEVQIDNTPVRDVAVEIGDSTGPAIKVDPYAGQPRVPDSSVIGAATIRAPNTLGRHTLKLTVRGADSAGVESPQPGFVTAGIVVKQ